MDRRPRVYVVNRSAHDYTPAAKYGDLVFVTQGRQNRYTANNHARMWAEALKDSQPDDYILLSSLNILCSIGCALFAMKHGKLNIIMYKPKIDDDGNVIGGKYVSRELALSELIAEMPEWVDCSQTAL